MSKNYHLKSGENLCKTCKYGKDRYGEACYCVKYGYIVSFGEKECRGYEAEAERRENG